MGTNIGMWLIWSTLIIIALFVFKLMVDGLVRLRTRSRSIPKRRSIDILKQRYVRGEMGMGEFIESIKNVFRE